MIIVDTREKQFQHVTDGFDELGIEWRMQKLDVGDYMIEGKPETVVDRKHGLLEVASNLCSSSHRFWREARRAHDTGTKLIILVEGTNVAYFGEIKDWHSKFTRVTGMDIQREIFRITRAFPNVSFKFCRSNVTAKRIIELLEGGE